MVVAVYSCSLSVALVDGDVQGAVVVEDLEGEDVVEGASEAVLAEDGETAKADNLEISCVDFGSYVFVSFFFSSMVSLVLLSFFWSSLSFLRFFLPFSMLSSFFGLTGGLWFCGQCCLHIPPVNQLHCSSQLTESGSQRDASSVVE